eukprot:gene5261-5496_t
MDDRDVLEAVTAEMVEQYLEDDSSDEEAPETSASKSKSKSKRSEELKPQTRKMKAERQTRVKLALVRNVYKDQWQAAVGAPLPFDASKPDPGLKGLPELQQLVAYTAADVARLVACRDEQSLPLGDKDETELRDSDDCLGDIIGMDSLLTADNLVMLLPPAVRLCLAADVAAGLLCDSQPLPPDTPEHGSTLLLFLWQALQNALQECQSILGKRHDHMWYYRPDLAKLQQLLDFCACLPPGAVIKQLRSLVERAAAHCWVPCMEPWGRGQLAGPGPPAAAVASWLDWFWHLPISWPYRQQQQGLFQTPLLQLTHINRQQHQRPRPVVGYSLARCKMFPNSFHVEQPFANREQACSNNPSSSSGPTDSRLPGPGGLQEFWCGQYAEHLLNVWPVLEPLLLWQSEWAQADCDEVDNSFVRSMAWRDLVRSKREVARLKLRRVKSQRASEASQAAAGGGIAVAGQGKAAAAGSNRDEARHGRVNPRQRSTATLSTSSSEDDVSDDSSWDLELPGSPVGQGGGGDDKEGGSSLSGGKPTRRSQASKRKLSPDAQIAKLDKDIAAARQKAVECELCQQEREKGASSSTPSPSPSAAPAGADSPTGGDQDNAQHGKPQQQQQQQQQQGPHQGSRVPYSSWPVDWQDHYLFRRLLWQLLGRIKPTAQAWFAELGICPHLHSETVWHMIAASIARHIWTPPTVDRRLQYLAVPLQLSSRLPSSTLVATPKRRDALLQTAAAISQSCLTRPADTTAAAITSLQVLLALDPHEERVQPDPDLLYFTPAGFTAAVSKALMTYCLPDQQQAWCGPALPVCCQANAVGADAGDRSGDATQKLYHDADARVFAAGYAVRQVLSRSQALRLLHNAPVPLGLQQQPKQWLQSLVRKYHRCRSCGQPLHNLQQRLCCLQEQAAISGYFPAASAAASGPPAATCPPRGRTTALLHQLADQAASRNGVALFRLLPALTCPGSTWDALTPDSQGWLNGQSLGVYRTESFSPDGCGRPRDREAIQRFMKCIWEEHLVVSQRCISIGCLKDVDLLADWHIRDLAASKDRVKRQQQGLPWDDQQHQDSDDGDADKWLEYRRRYAAGTGDELCTQGELEDM